MSHSAFSIFIIFGTRPEVIKLFPIIEMLRDKKDFKIYTISTSQHREMIDDLIHLFSIELDHDLNIMQHGQSLSSISKHVISGLERLFIEYRPNLVLVQGDTTTALISSLTAFYHKIPVGHIEAGLRSFNRDHPYPEEINRRLISVLSDLHFTPTKQNTANLRNEGIDSTKIFLTGNTVVDSLLHITSKNDQTLSEYLPLDALNSHKMILVTCHRRENWGAPLENLCFALQELLSSHSDIQILFPVHLNPIVRKTVFKILGRQERVHLLDPLPYKAFIEAMAESHFIITDSGGVQEEGPSFNKPILVYRQVTERPEGVAAGCAKVIGLARENFLKETSRLLDDMQAYQSMTSSGNPYGDGRAAERIVQAIRHYFFGEDRPTGFVAQC